MRNDSLGSRHGIDRVDHLFCGHNCRGVARNIDVKSSVHFNIRIIRSRVSYHCDLVAKFNGETNRCLHARMRDESHDDESMDTVFLELQIQIRVGETTGTPMLLDHDFARLRLELAADFATPRAVLKRLVQPSCLLHWSNVLPSLIVAWTVSTMQRIEDAQLCVARSIQ